MASVGTESAVGNNFPGAQGAPCKFPGLEKIYIAWFKHNPSVTAVFPPESACIR
jgi:hypothetical protein